MKAQAASVEILRDGMLHKVHFLNQWKTAIRYSTSISGFDLSFSYTIMLLARK